MGLAINRTACTNQTLPHSYITYVEVVMLSPFPFPKLFPSSLGAGLSLIFYPPYTILQFSEIASNRAPPSRKLLLRYPAC